MLNGEHGVSLAARPSKLCSPMLEPTRSQATIGASLLDLAPLLGPRIGCCDRRKPEVPGRL